jgi:hypothetical protein
LPSCAFIKFQFVTLLLVLVLALTMLLAEASQLRASLTMVVAVGELRPAASGAPPQASSVRPPQASSPSRHRHAATGMCTAELCFGAARGGHESGGHASRLWTLHSLDSRLNRHADRSTRRLLESPPPPLGFEFGSKPRGEGMRGVERREHLIESTSQCGGGKMDIFHIPGPTCQCFLTVDF